MLNWIFNRLKGDKIIWLTVFLLMLVSILAIYSASTTLAFRLKAGNTEYFALRHALLLVVGLVIMYFVHLMDYRIFARIANLLIFITIPLLLYTLMRGSEINEAARWVSFFGQSFQPSDLAKVSFMIFLAKLLAERQAVIKDFNDGFLPALFWMVLVCGLIAPANLSTAILIFLSTMMMLFVAGSDMKYLLLIFAVALVGMTILFTTAKRSSTWKSRIDEYMHRVTEREVDAASYQTVQANIAVASGGLIGKGPGRSAQRYYLPQAYSDFVYAVIIEEYGLIGGMVVLGLYLLLLFRAVSIITLSKTFGALMATGLAFMISLQAIINMGVTVGVLPITGLVLPLISMGGTSILFTCVMLGIILSVSRDAMKGREEIAPVAPKTGGRIIPGINGTSEPKPERKRNFLGLGRK